MDPADKGGGRRQAGPARTPEAPPMAGLKPGELPSVLRTSGDLAPGLKKQHTPGAAAALHAMRQSEQASGNSSRPALPAAPADVFAAAAATLPKLDGATGGASPLHASHAPRTAVSPPLHQRHATPERPRTIKPQQQQQQQQQEALCSSGDGPPMAAKATDVAAAQQPWRGSSSSSSSSVGRAAPDGSPAAGSAGVGALPASLQRKLAAGDGTDSRAAAAARQPSPCTGTAVGSEGVQLLRPVDPTKPGYYWKPAQAAAEAAAPPGGADNVLGYQLLQEVAGLDGTAAQASHTLQRRSMLMRLPLGTEHLMEAVPGALQDRDGHACLLVLPSDQPSSRKEALAVEALLGELLKDPASAVPKACQWRASTLAALCTEGLAVVAEGLKHKGPAGGWQLRKLNRNLTGQVLGSGMVEALDALLTSSSASTTAEKMAALLNSKEATAQVGATAAAAVAAAAAAAVLPASTGLLQRRGTSGGAEAAAAAAAEQQQQQQQQQQSLDGSAAAGADAGGGQHGPGGSNAFRSLRVVTGSLGLLPAAKESPAGAAARAAAAVALGAPPGQPVAAGASGSVSNGSRGSLASPAASATGSRVASPALPLASPAPADAAGSHDSSRSPRQAPKRPVSPAQPLQQAAGVAADAAADSSSGQQQQQQAPGKPGGQQQPQAGSAASAAAAGQLQLRGPSHLYSLALAASICMADLVRQVEVSCVERGRALAYAWNCSVGAAEAVVGELRCQNRQLLALNGEMAAQQAELARELKGVDFLRREAMRFRKAMEEAAAEAAAAEADNAQLRGRVAAAEGAVNAVAAFARRRLAQLRWRNAFATLGTWSQQSIIQSGLAGPGGQQLLQMVMMLDRMVNAVNAVERRKAAWGRKATTEAYEARGTPLVTDVVQAVTHGPQVATPRRGADGGGADGTLTMLGALTPEARAMVLAAMPAGQRWHVLAAMRDEERAQVVVAMSLGLRKEAAAGLERGCWEATMEAVRNNSVFGARYLLAMELDAAAADFHAWGRYQQLDVLTALDAHTAAGLLTRLPEELRRELLGMLEPYAAANIVQAMMPPPAAAAMESLDIKKAMAILVAMDPNKAADVLTEMGAPKAASKLVLMDSDARNSIIESMAPRVAAVTLTSMGDSLAAAGEGGRPSSAELLSLGGGPVMGAMSELDAANAYSIMSYMSVQDKAALLASMDPDVVARLLGVMDPREAVLLLAALGDDSGRLVSQALSSDERSRLIEVLQAAEAEAAAGGSPAQARPKRKGSSQQADAAVVERLVDAYQVIEAGALEEEEEEEPPPLPAASSNGCSKAKASRPSQPAQRTVGVQVGSSSGGSGGAAGRGTAAEAGSSAAAPLAAEPSAAMLAAGAGDGGRRQVQVSVSDADGSDDVDDAAAEAAAGNDTAAGDAGAAAAAAKRGTTSRSKPPQQQRGAKPAKPHAAAGDGTAAVAAQGRRASRPDEARAARQEEQRRRTSTCSSSYDDLTIEEVAPAELVQPPPAGDSSSSVTKRGTAAAKPAAARAPAGAAARSRKPAPAAGDTDGTGAPPPRAFRRGSSSVGLAGADAVPPLPLSGAPGGGAGRVEASVSFVSFEESSPPASARRGKDVDEEPSVVVDEADASSDSTPRNAAGTAGISAGGVASAATPARSTTTRAAAPVRNAAAAAASAAAGRNALREALRMQATKRRAPAVKEPSQPAAAGDEDADGPSSSSSSSAGAASAPEAPPQARLGRLPKNARLIEAMAQHKNAKPKPKGWLMAVVDCIYKEGETLLRKLGRGDMIKKQSVPEIVFAYFHNKYGQRALVNENVGSLVNTLSLHQHSDLRLEAFARLLSEEWDVSIFIDFLSATSLCLQPAKLACIEYPREAGKDEQYASVCLYKATWVADAILGTRTQPARERFVEFLRMAAHPADEADVERLRRERREAAAKELASGGGGGSRAADGGELPEAFFKLPRIRFLLILCKEIWRINRFIASFAEDRFASMDVQHAGRVDVVPVRAFVKAMSPGASDAQVSDNINAFVSTAEGHARDAAPESVAVASVTDLTREAFVAGVVNTPSVRDHIKASLLAPARLEEDDAEAQVFCNLLTVLMSRHTAALLPFWQAALAGAGEAGRLLAAQVAALSAPGTGGDARLKAYVSLLLGLVSATLQRYLDGVLAPGADEDGAASVQLEEGLARLEDAALIVTGGTRIAYLLQPDDAGLALARMARLPLSAQLPAMGAALLQHRRMAGTMAVHAARVLQAAWRRRQRQARAAADAAGGSQ